MEPSALCVDLSDDDEDNVVRTIQLQKSLISESQLLTKTEVELTECDRQQQNLEEIHDINNQNDANSAADKDDETSYRNALAANVEYDNYLARLETNLKTLISECKSKLDELSRVRQNSLDNKQKSALGRPNHMYIFGAPFFKDKDYYPCPPNADTLIKAQNDELCWVDLPATHWWTPAQTKLLVDAIKDFSLQACLLDAQKARNALIRRLNSLEGDNNAEEGKRLEDEIANFDIDNYAQSHLNEKIATMDHDWLKLSASVLNGKHNAEECRGFWYNYLHPKFYKGKWSEEEIEKLKSVAEENNCQDWDLIAEKLGTKRSGYQCFAQHQSEVLEQVRLMKKWSKEEDDLLRSVVEKNRVGDYIPWSQVAVQMKGRTKTQVYNRWTYSLDPKIKKGRFTIQEDIIILRGVQKWGEDFQRIASYIPNRMAPQIRVRYHSSISKANFTPWTLEEDNALLELVKKYGHNWSKLAEHFPGKSSWRIRHRHDNILKWIEANPGKPLKVSSRQNNRPHSIYNLYPEMWTFADKLLSGDNPKSLSTSLLVPKPASAQKVRIKKMSAVDEKLNEYFRGTYYKPSFSTRKFSTRPEIKPELIADVASFLELLGAKLNIPSDEVLDLDPSLDLDDKKVLKGLRSFYQDAPEEGSQPREDNSNVRAETNEPEVQEMDPLDISIDYVPKSDASSTQVKLEYIFDSSPAPVDPLCTTVTETTDSTPPPHPLYGYLKYLCPPNTSTLVGLRSLLLGKRKLVESISEFATDPILTEVDDRNNDNFRRANLLFEDRLMCLFAFPNLLSKLSPDEGFKDGSGVSPGPSGLPPLRRENLDSDSEVEPVPSTSRRYTPPSFISDGVGNVRVFTGTKRPPAKKASGAAKRAKK